MLLLGPQLRCCTVRSSVSRLTDLAAGCLSASAASLAWTRSCCIIFGSLEWRLEVLPLRAGLLTARPLSELFCFGIRPAVPSSVSSAMVALGGIWKCCWGSCTTSADIVLWCPSIPRLRNRAIPRAQSSPVDLPEDGLWFLIMPPGWRWEALRPVARCVCGTWARKSLLPITLNTRLSV